MKKSFFYTILILSYFTQSQAQEFDLGNTPAVSSSFIVWQVEGSAEYFENANSSAQEVVSGMTLPEIGTIDLKKKSMLKLSWKSQTVILDKKGTYSLKNEAKKLADASGNEPVMDDFLMEMGAASGFGEEGGDGDGDRSRARRDTLGGSGWGSGKSINPIMPIGGIVPSDLITFSWAGESGEKGFNIQVYSLSDSKLIFSAATKNNSLTFDVSQLLLDEGEEYTWHVENMDEASIKSEKIKITFANKNQDEEVIRGMLSDREYSYSDPWMKLLREAHALQKENMLYAANEKYKEGIATYSDNKIIRNMYARFLTKYGLEAVADELYK